MTSILAADSIEPIERTVGRSEDACEAFGSALRGEREARRAGEGRGAAPADPRQKIAAFGRVPRTGQFGRLKPWVVLRPLVFLGKVTDMHAPKPTHDRKSVVKGKSVSVRVDLVGRSIIKKKTTIHN